MNGDERLTIARWLDARGACGPGSEWARAVLSFEQLWERCPNIEWLLWGVAQVGYDRNAKLRGFAVSCAMRRAGEWDDEIFTGVVRTASAHAAGHARTGDLLRARQQGLAAAERLARAPGWSAFAAASRACAVACTRVDPLQAARGAALESLRALEWIPRTPKESVEEQRWQLGELRRWLLDDSEDLVRRARTSARAL